MSSKLYSWIYGLLLCGLFSSSIVAAESVAMVTDLLGVATIASSKGKRTVAILSELPSGTEIFLGKNCQLVVVYMKSGSEFQMTGPAKVSIGSETPKLVSGGTLTHRFSLLVAEAAKLETKGNKLVQGGIRMRGNGEQGVQLQTPHGKIFQPNPLFQWTTSADDQMFTFMLRENEVLVETQVRGGVYRLPENIKLVPEIVYTWAVEFDEGNGSVNLSSAEFSLASEEERTHFMQLKPKPDAPFSDRILYAVLLNQANFREEAQIIWAELSAERPKLSELREMAIK